MPGDTHYLVGAEDVRAGGHAIRGAAQDMQQVAGTIDNTFQQHQRFLDDWLERFTAVLEADREARNGR